MPPTGGRGHGQLPTSPIRASSKREPVAGQRERIDAVEQGSTPRQHDGATAGSSRARAQAAASMPDDRADPVPIIDAASSASAAATRFTMAETGSEYMRMKPAKNVPTIEPIAPRNRCRRSPCPTFVDCSTAILATTGPIIPSTVAGTRKSSMTTTTVRRFQGMAVKPGNQPHDRVHPEATERENAPERVQRPDRPLGRPGRRVDRPAHCPGRCRRA